MSHISHGTFNFDTVCYACDKNSAARIKHADSKVENEIYRRIGILKLAMILKCMVN